jgi:hypothetical protein
VAPVALAPQEIENTKRKLAAFGSQFYFFYYFNRFNTDFPKKVLCKMMHMVYNGYRSCGCRCHQPGARRFCAFCFGEMGNKKPASRRA